MKENHLNCRIFHSRANSNTNTNIQLEWGHWHRPPSPRPRACPISYHYLTDRFSASTTSLELAFSYPLGNSGSATCGAMFKLIIICGDECIRTLWLLRQKISHSFDVHVVMVMTEIIEVTPGVNRTLQIISASTMKCSFQQKRLTLASQAGSLLGDVYTGAS